jgi:hypothetical protein
VAACLLLAPAREARALEVALSAPRAQESYLWVDASLTDLFPGAVERSLSRGMPATLQLHAELWRPRTAWFDRMERTFDASVRIRYEVWNDSYRIERSGAAPRSLGTLDSVRALLERPIALPVAPLERLVDETDYYVVVSVTLAPLNVEDVKEVEGWLSGEVQSQRHSGFGVFTELPRSLFDTVRNLTGLGDRHAHAQTARFQLSDLGAAP